ncbi:hypothetical protein ABZW49_10145 [Nonomuraea wenchangensis]
MASKDQQKEYLDSLSEVANHSHRAEWSPRRQAAQRRAGTALLAMLGESLPDEKSGKQR